MLGTDRVSVNAAACLMQPVPTAVNDIYHLFVSTFGITQHLMHETLSDTLRCAWTLQDVL